MPRRLAAKFVKVAAAMAAMGGALPSCREESPAPSSACFEASQVRVALEAVPGGAARLPDGTTLSRCVELSASDEFLQDLGLVFTASADELGDAAISGDAAAAERLGFLVGAAQRGAARGQGVQLELVRRLESSARRATADDPRVAQALRTGLRAGERSG